MSCASATAARTLAHFASALELEAIPELDRERARQCLIDAVGVALFGASQPWSRMVATYARQYGGQGTSRIIGEPGPIAAPLAALTNGVFAHAFELDSLRKPGAGVHPGAALVPTALALGEEIGVAGKALITAIVAGCEVMFRIGIATRQSVEPRGFHSPGLTGPFGAAVTAGHLLGLDAARMTHALGIAGSLCGGLLAFVKAGNGAMVKRLHLGRAAEAGVLAARLAAQGFEGPDTILDGDYGFLASYGKDYDATLLTQGLGERFETRNLCLKRYPCHIMAHTPLQAIEALRAAQPFTADDVEKVTVRGSHKMQSHHADPAPTDTMAAQYSVPFCVAVGIAGNPMDPAAFGERGRSDPRIRTLLSRIDIAPWRDNAERNAWASEVTVLFADGRERTAAADDFPGTPTSPLSAEQLRDKFRVCAAGYASAETLLAQLEAIETMPDVRVLALG